MKRIFLTGASSGIGLAIAKALSAQVTKFGERPVTAKGFLALPRMHAISLDLTDRDSLGERFHTALREAEAFRGRDQQRRERLLWSRRGAFA